jgi:prevent-host-death family protein
MTAVTQHVPREISQRELRDDAGDILSAVEHGETFVVTRNGDPIAELIPVRRRKFVPTEEVLAAFANEPPIDAGRFFADLDALVDQRIVGE